MKHGERLKKIDARRRGRTVKHLDLDPLLFREQLRFATDEARHKTAVCSRRAGKTMACAASLLDTALRRPKSVSLYLTLSRLNAKRIVWRTLLDLNREHHLGAEGNETELVLRFPNGSAIYLAGASDKTEIEKYRGMPLALVVVDEAQSFPPYLQELVDAVLTPALMDFNGSLALVGTPGPVPNSYFHGCSTSPGWSHHAWTVFENPHIELKSCKTPQAHLADELKRRGVMESDPVIQREWKGIWVHDPNSLVFRFEAQRNTFAELPHVERPYQHVIGVDLGFDDADAIAVLAWSDDSPNLYLVEEWVGAKQTITELGDRLRVFEQRYQPTAIVCDTGGLGKKIVHEITKRTGVALEAAEKERKLEHIELVNDALRSVRLLARPGSRFAQDCLLVEWDKATPERPRISDRFHSDIVDAVLYAFRRAYHYLHEPSEPAKPRFGTDAFAQMTLRLQRERAQKRAEADRRSWEEPLERALEEAAERRLQENEDWQWERMMIRDPWQ